MINNEIPQKHQYLLGNIFAYVTSAGLIFTTISFWNIARAAKAGKGAGLEWIALALVIPYYIAIFLVILSLLLTAARYKKLPSNVAKKRFIVTLLALLSLMLPSLAN